MRPVALWTAAVAGAALLACAAAPAGAQEARFAQGGKIFQAQCAVCHQPKGTGLPGLAPPLTRNPGQYATIAEGRRQLALMVLYGMFGEITVDGKSYNFKMPTFKALSDDDLAAVANYVAFDIAQAPASTAPLTAADIAAERKTELTGHDVREHRAKVLAELGR